MVYKIIKITDISDETYADTYAALHPTRREYIERLKVEKMRRCSLAGEFLAKEILKESYNVSLPIIKRNENGKPYTESGINISISHCDDFVVCVADENEIGIDMEKIKPVSDALIKRVCTEEEMKYVYEPVSKDTVISRFFEVWTAKEAYFKKEGTGITDFKSVNILNLNREIINFEDFIIQIVK